MDSRKILLFITIMALVALHLACSDKSVTSNNHSTNHVDGEPFEYAFDASAYTGISLDGINGEVRISGEPGLDSVSISGIRRVRSDSDTDAEEYLQLLTVTVVDTSDWIEITVEQPSDTEWRSLTVDFDFIIPRDYESRITIVNGNVTINSLEADMQISIVNGNLDFDLINGQSSMEIVNGQIHGNMNLPPGGSSAFSIVNGVIDIGMPQTTSAQFSASVANGGITVNDLLFRNYHETPTSFSGTLGEGDGTIAMSVVNGTISAEGY